MLSVEDRERSRNAIRSIIFPLDGRGDGRENQSPQEYKGDIEKTTSEKMVFHSLIWEKTNSGAPFQYVCISANTSARFLFSLPFGPTHTHTQRYHADGVRRDPEMI